MSHLHLVLPEKDPREVVNTWPSNIGWNFNKVYHWTRSKKGHLTLHPGSPEKCRRVHPKKP